MKPFIWLLLSSVTCMKEYALLRIEVPQRATRIGCSDMNDGWKLASGNEKAISVMEDIKTVWVGELAMNTSAIPSDRTFLFASGRNCCRVNNGIATCNRSICDIRAAVICNRDKQ